MLGEKLKNARKAKGFSQDEVAEKLKVTRQTVSKWENGRTAPDVETLVKLSDLYETSLDLLMRENGNQECQIKEEREEGDNNHILLAVLVVLVVSCMIPALGLPVSVAVLVYCKRKKQSKILIALAILCLMINLVNLGIIINDVVLHMGKATVF